MCFREHVRRAVSRVLTDFVRTIDNLIVPPQPSVATGDIGSRTEQTSSGETPRASSAEKQPQWRTTGQGAVRNLSQTQVSLLLMLGSASALFVPNVIAAKPHDGNQAVGLPATAGNLLLLDYLYPSALAVTS